MRNARGKLGSHVHFIAKVIYDLLYTGLYNLDSTFKAGAPNRHQGGLSSSDERQNPYVLQYRTAPSPTRSLPASRRAFSSACKHTHSSGISLAVLHRVHPPSLQLVSPRGVPL